MVTVFYYIYYNVAGVIVTKGAGSLGGGGGGGREHGGGTTEVFWESPCSAEPDYFGFLSCQPKIFRSKLFFSTFFTSNAHIIYLSTTPNSSKVFKRIIVMNI
jgi:hypothetical protein